MLPSSSPDRNWWSRKRAAVGEGVRVRIDEPEHCWSSHAEPNHIEHIHVSQKLRCSEIIIIDQL